MSNRILSELRAFLPSLPLVRNFSGVEPEEISIMTGLSRHPLSLCSLLGVRIIVACAIPILNMELQTDTKNNSSNAKGLIRKNEIRAELLVILITIPLLKIPKDFLTASTYNNLLNTITFPGGLPFVLNPNETQAQNQSGKYPDRQMPGESKRIHFQTAQSLNNTQNPCKSFGVFSVLAGNN